MRFPPKIRQIASSIKRFGFTNPALVGDEDEIIAGHGRGMATKQLGMERVPTLRLQHPIIRCNGPVSKAALSCHGEAAIMG